MVVCFHKQGAQKRKEAGQKSGLRLKKNQYNQFNHLNEHNDPNHRNDLSVYRRHTKSLLFPLGEWLRVTAEKIC